MSNRVRGFTVTLTDDMREDDIEQIITAISMIKGVLHVDPTITTASDYISDVRARADMRGKLVNFIQKELCEK